MVTVVRLKTCAALTALAMATIRKCRCSAINKMKFFIPTIILLVGCANPDINVDVSPTITSTTSSTSSSEAINENEVNQTHMRDNNNSSGEQHSHCEGCREHCLNNQ
jgi:hypothetical protein